MASKGGKNALLWTGLIAHFMDSLLRFLVIIVHYSRLTLQYLHTVDCYGILSMLYRHYAAAEHGQYI